MEKGQLNFDSPESILNNPEILIKIFEVSARLNIPLSREALRLVREFNYLVTEEFYTSVTVMADFEKILLSPPGSFNVLEQMLDTGFLAHLIPEYRRVADRIQYDAYHLYPVDRHLLRTVYILKMFGEADVLDSDDLCLRLYSGLKRKKLLLLAALLHDIGKVGISDQILTKSGPLDKREREEIKRHSEIGIRIYPVYNKSCCCSSGRIFNREGT